MKQLFHFDRSNKIKKEIGHKKIIRSNNPNKRLFRLIDFLEKKVQGSEKLISRLKYFNLGNDFPTENIFDLWNNIQEPRIEEDIKTYSIEVVFENIRQKEFKNLPSRFECIYLTNNIEDWHDIIHYKKSSKSYIVYTFELTKVEKYFCADGNIVTLASKKSYNEVIELARNYWSGNFSLQPKNEILFCGTLKVINKINRNIIHAN